jgi:hypothetical protein
MTVAAVYGTFVYDFGDRDHVFQPVGGSFWNSLHLTYGLKFTVAFYRRVHG